MLSIPMCMSLFIFFHETHSFVRLFSWDITCVNQCLYILTMVSDETEYQHLIRAKAGFLRCSVPWPPGKVTQPPPMLMVCLGSAVQVVRWLVPKKPRSKTSPSKPQFPTLHKPGIVRFLKPREPSLFRECLESVEEELLARYGMQWTRQMSPGASSGVGEVPWPTGTVVVLGTGSRLTGPRRPAPKGDTGLGWITCRGPLILYVSRMPTMRFCAQNPDGTIILLLINFDNFQV